MAEYVKRGDVMEAYNKQIYSNEYRSFEELLKSVQKADVASVVRCKDCIRRYDTDECPMRFFCNGKYYEYTSDDDFCSYGERKEDAAGR